MTRESRGISFCFFLVEEKLSLIRYWFFKIGFCCLHTHSESRGSNAVSMYLCISPSGWGARQGLPVMFSKDQRKHFLGYSKTFTSLVPWVAEPGATCWAKQGIQSLLTRPCTLEMIMATNLYEALTTCQKCGAWKHLLLLFHSGLSWCHLSCEGAHNPG